MHSFIENDIKRIEKIKAFKMQLNGMKRLKMCIKLNCKNEIEKLQFNEIRSEWRVRAI